MEGNGSAARVLRVSRGLFVFRYVSSRAGIEAPEVMISVEPGSGVEIISSDGSPRPVLRNPGDAVVVRADRDSSMRAAITPVRAGGSRDAQFVFERIALSPPADDYHSEPADHYGHVPFSPPMILAHVARRGDVTVASGEWVCGPQFPMVIEGIQVVWPDRPHDVDLVVGCQINSRGRRVFPPAPSGNFVGTRGKAAPLIGVSLALVGRNAAGYRLACEALFLGCQVQAQEGSDLELSGPTGLEPLVGLRIRVLENARSTSFSRDSLADRPADVPMLSAAGRTYSPRAPGNADLFPPPAPAVLPAPSVSKTGRVRVFRAERPISNAR
jgi:hypothetical protein